MRKEVVFLGGQNLELASSFCYERERERASSSTKENTPNLATLLMISFQNENLKIGYWGIRVFFVSFLHPLSFFGGPVSDSTFFFQSLEWSRLVLPSAFVAFWALEPWCPWG